MTEQGKTEITLSYLLEYVGGDHPPFPKIYNRPERLERLERIIKKIEMEVKKKERKLPNHRTILLYSFPAEKLRAIKEEYQKLTPAELSKILKVLYDRNVSPDTLNWMARRGKLPAKKQKDSRHFIFNKALRNALKQNDLTAAGF